MPLFRQPFSLRYLKARLRVLQRPQVWGTAAGLVLTIALVSNYGLHPNRFRVSNPLDSGGQSPAAADSIAPTIPSLPILPDLQSRPSPASGNFRRQATTDAKANTLPTPANPSIDRNTPMSLQQPAPASLNPFSPDAFPLLPQGGEDGDRSVASAINPLRTAIDRFSPVSVRSASENIAPAGVTPQGVTLPAIPAAPPQPGTPLYLPRTSPPPGTTGYTLPPSLANPNLVTPAPYLALPQPVPGLPASPTGTNFVYGMPNAVTSPVQPQIQPQVPPVVMPTGRPIGNGQVNTFSNP